MSDLQDVFAGEIEFTAGELAYLRYAITELYMTGGWCPPGEDRREFTQRLLAKLKLPLRRMVAPDGSGLVSVEGHTALVAQERSALSVKLGESPAPAPTIAQRKISSVCSIYTPRHGVHGNRCVVCEFGPIEHGVVEAREPDETRANDTEVVIHWLPLEGPDSRSCPISDRYPDRATGIPDRVTCTSCSSGLRGGDKTCLSPRIHQPGSTRCMLPIDHAGRHDDLRETAFRLTWPDEDIHL